MTTVKSFPSVLPRWQQRPSTLLEQPHNQSTPAVPQQACSSTFQETIPAWLEHVIEDNSPAPTLFAWTATNLTSDPTSAPRTARRDAAARIHVLGVGNLGRLLATSLSQIPEAPPITLVVHRKSLLEHWNSAPGIEITRQGRVERFTDFDVEWWTPEAPESGPVQELTPITNLIVATKATAVMPQIDRLRRYLHGGSTVAFVQNGMCKLWGSTGDLYQRLRFPDHTGPSWLACVTTHGVSSLADFKSAHTSLASISIGPVSTNTSHGDAQHHYLLRQIERAPYLMARVVSRGEIWAMQLEKVVVNSVLNPLTAAMDCENGELFVDRGDMLPKVIDALIWEASIVLTQLVVGTAKQSVLGGDEREAVLQRFSFSCLRMVVYDVMYKVRFHIGSMLQDVRAGRKTEIQEYNGWLLRTAESLGIGRDLPTHEKMIAIIESGGKLSRHQLVQHCLSEHICV